MNKLRIQSNFFLLVIIIFCSCKNSENAQTSRDFNSANSVTLTILGTIQDGGSPHIGCKKDCCKDLFLKPEPNRQVVSLGLVDNVNNKKYLFEATPDMSRQIKALSKLGITNQKEVPDGIFLTHAHIGHYAGLMFLGKEAGDAKEVPVFAMPRMKKFLEENGPWSQLVKNKNIALTQIDNEQTLSLTSLVKVTPLLVPHRDEFSETVGYKIQGQKKTALFIPDIDKWEKWSKNITEEIQNVDYAFLDATFYSGKEIDNRDISKIPHPFIIESMEKFKDLPASEKAKIIFIHFNHTNPVINKNSEESKMVEKNGFRVARMGEVFKM